MLEIPVLAQAFEDGKSPYQSDPYINLVYGNWYEETISACENLKELRARAKKAKKYVLENYDINKNIHLWEKAYAKLY
jgi:hypothetical protein